MGICRILVIDPHPQVRRALITTLGRLPGAVVVGETADADEGVRLAASLQPHAIVLEPKRFDGPCLVRRLHEAAPESRILVYTSYSDLVEEEALLAAGARAYLLKTLDRDVLSAWLAEEPSSSAPGAPLSHPTE